MGHQWTSRCVKQVGIWLFSCLLSSLMVSHALAFDLRIDGFGSVVFGKAVSNAPLPGASESSYPVSPTFASTSSGRINTDARYSTDIDSKPESLLGIQLTMTTDSPLSGALQVTAHGANDYKAEVEWLYLSYQLRDNLSISLGRQRIPFYLYSDYLDVGYAYHWIRPPIDIYSEGISTYDGISLNYQTLLADWQASVDLYYSAKVKNDTAVAWRARDEDLAGVVFTLEKQWLTIRAAYHYADKAYTDVGNLLTFPAKTITRDNPAEGYFASLGVMADFDRYFIGAEYTQLGADPIYEAVSFVGNTALINQGKSRQTAMLTAGYRHHDWTFHSTVSLRRFDVAVPAAGLVDLADQERRTWSIGARWDVAPNLALKADVTEARDFSDNNSKALFGNRLQATVVSVGLDFLF